MVDGAAVDAIGWDRWHLCGLLAATAAPMNGFLDKRADDEALGAMEVGVVKAGTVIFDLNGVNGEGMAITLQMNAAYALLLQSNAGRFIYSALKGS